LRRRKKTSAVVSKNDCGRFSKPLRSFSKTTAVVSENGFGRNVCRWRQKAVKISAKALAVQRKSTTFAPFYKSITLAKANNNGGYSLLYIGALVRLFKKKSGAGLLQTRRIWRQNFLEST